MRNFIQPVSALLSFAVCGGALLGAPPAIRLRVKPYTQPIDFVIQDSHSKMVLDPRQIVPTEKFDSLERTRQFASGTTENGIQFTVDRLKRDLYVNGDPITKNLITPSRFTYIVTPRGETVEAEPSDPIGRALAPVFPENDISPGYSWSVTLPPSPKLPTELKVTHVLEEVGDVDGIPSATIMSKGIARGVEPTTGSKILVDVTGKVSYALADGAVVRSKSEVQFQMLEPKAGSKFIPFHQITWRTVRRWSAMNTGVNPEVLTPSSPAAGPK